MTAADDYLGNLKSVISFRAEIENWVSRMASEGVIDAFVDEDAKCLTIRIHCTLKTPMHTKAVQRQIMGLVNSARLTVPRDSIKIRNMDTESLLHLVLATPPREGTRWLQQTKGTLDGLPLPEVVARYGVNIRMLETSILECRSRDDFRDASVELQTLHYLVHKCLVAKLGDLVRANSSIPGIQQDSELTQTIARDAVAAAAAASAAAANSTPAAPRTETEPIPKSPARVRRLDFTNDSTSQGTPTLDQRVLITAACIDSFSLPSQRPVLSCFHQAQVARQTVARSLWAQGTRNL